MGRACRPKDLATGGLAEQNRKVEGRRAIPERDVLDPGARTGTAPLCPDRRETFVIFLITD